MGPTIGGDIVATKTFRVIRSGALPGARNMALDEALMGGDGTPVPTLRLYRWLPWTLTLGRFQGVEAAHLDPFRERGWEVTRRATGGGAIFHADELTYSLVLPAGDGRIPRNTADSYHWIHGAVTEALGRRGANSGPRGPGGTPPGEDPFFCFDRTAAIDLVSGGRKIVGSAQRRTRRAFLQHGSILLGDHPTAPGSVSLADLAGVAAADPVPLEDALVDATAALLGATPEEESTTEDELLLGSVGEEERYGHPGWVLHAGRRGGREASAPDPQRIPGSPPAEPLRVLRARLTEEGLQVEGSMGGARPLLPHTSLVAIEAVRWRTEETRALLLERDPWDSTFQRSHFEPPPTGMGPEGGDSLGRTVVEETLALGLLYGDGSVAHMDARRFNYTDLGDDRTGDWPADFATLLHALVTAAPAAARGPGIRAWDRRHRPHLAGDPRSLTRSLMQLAGRS
jgi:lipoate-protein ligase A